MELEEVEDVGEIPYDLFHFSNVLRGVSLLLLLSLFLRHQQGVSGALVRIT